MLTGVGAGLKTISILFFFIVWNIVRRKAMAEETEQTAPEAGLVN